jgi:RNA polymerase primary sigma factor
MNFEKSESLERYFKSIQNLNPLTKEEELDLAKRIQAGDEKALNKLVEHNLKIVVTIANGQRGRGIEIDDLIQQGNLGLFDAARRFKPEYDVRFASFASTRIFKNINKLIDDCGRAVRIPVNQEFQRFLDKKKGVEVSNITTVRLDGFIRDDDGQTKGAGIGATRPEIEIQHETDHVFTKVNHLLSLLKPRDRAIMKMYYGIDEDEEISTKDIAAKLGLTQIRVCQIINSAKERLREEV